MSRPLLVIVASAPTTAELRRRRDAAALAGADLVELRIDSVADPDIAAALAGRTTPVIVTCRPEWEGGAFKDSEVERRRILECALQQGAEYVDVEFKAGFCSELIAATGGKRIVLSTHDFEGVPADLIERVRAMRAARARDRQGGRDGSLVVRQPASPSARTRGEYGAHWDGAVGCTDTSSGRALSLSVVIRRRRLRSWPDFGGADAERIQVPRGHRSDRHLRRRGFAAHALDFAGDAQRRIPRGRRRRCLRADGGIERGRLHDLCDGARRAGRQHHDSLQGGSCSSARTTWTISAAGWAR